MAQGQADVVPAVEQAFLAERINAEGNEMTIRATHRLFRQIDQQAVARRGIDLLEQRLDFIRRQRDQQNAVLETVAEKNVGEALGQDDAETVIEQRPGRMFTRTATAEVLARQQNVGPGITRLIQHEIRVLRARLAILSGLADIHIAPLVEEIRAESRPLDRFQKLLGDDRVGIDIGPIQRCHQSVEANEFFHDFPFQP